MKFVLASITSIAMVALIYAEAAKPLIDMGTGNGALSGRFSVLLVRIDNLVPAVLGALLLGVLVYLVLGSARRERSVDRRPRRRR